MALKKTLTPAEQARLVKRIGEGMGLSETARIFGVSVKYAASLCQKAGQTVNVRRAHWFRTDAVRKEHTCVLCAKPIVVGTACYYQEKRDHIDRKHIDCATADVDVPRHPWKTYDAQQRGRRRSVMDKP